MHYSIKGINMRITGALRQHIDEHMQKLKKFYSHIINARFEIGITTRHHHKGEIFRAEGNLNVPGRLIRADSTHTDLYIAVDQMARKLKRELIRCKDREKKPYRHKGV